MADAAPGPLVLWRRLAGAQVRSQLQYRLSFALYTAGQFLASFVDFLALAVLFTKVDALGGWSVAEVALLYGLTGIAFNVCDLAIGAADSISLKIRDGSFDGYLIRPAPALLQLSADGFALRRAGKVLQALIVFGLAVRLLDLTWDVRRVALVLVAIACGVAIYAAVWTATASIAFWVIDAREIGNAFTYGGNFLANQPLSIYAAWLRAFAVYVLPIAFAAYLPATLILDKPLPPGIPAAAPYLTPLVAAAAVAGAAWIWRVSLRRYRSTGS